MGEHMAEVVKVEDNPKRPYKAIVAAALPFVGTFASLWLLDTAPFTAEEFKEALLAAVLVATGSGGGTFITRNPKVAKQQNPQ